MWSSRPSFLERGGAALLVFGLFVAGGLVFVFAGTLARATELEAEAAAAASGLARDEARLEAGRAEVLFVQSDAFIEHQARAEGFGRPGEIAFQLPDDAPPPPTIVPLGPTGEVSGPVAPLDAWLEFLFAPDDASSAGGP